MAWSGANMRCPACNKYMPDRCVCKKEAMNHPTPSAHVAASIPTWQERAAAYKTKWHRLPPPAEDFMREEIAELRSTLAAAGAPAEPPKPAARPDLAKLTCWSYNPKRGLFRHPEGNMFMIEDVEVLFAHSSATGAGDTEDAARLEFLMEREAWIAWSKDGESCRLFHRSDDGEPMPMLGWGARHWSHDPREAIDAAMQEGASMPAADK